MLDGQALERLVADGFLRLPIAAALLESYPAVDDEFLVSLLDATVRVEESELAAFLGPGLIR